MSAAAAKKAPSPQAQRTLGRYRQWKSKPVQRGKLLRAVTAPELRDYRARGTPLELEVSVRFAPNALENARIDLVHGDSRARVVDASLLLLSLIGGLWADGGRALVASKADLVRLFGCSTATWGRKVGLLMELGWLQVDRNFCLNQSGPFQGRHSELACVLAPGLTLLGVLRSSGVQFLGPADPNQKTAEFRRRYRGGEEMIDHPDPDSGSLPERGSVTVRRVNQSGEERPSAAEGPRRAAPLTTRPSSSRPSVEPSRAIPLGKGFEGSGFVLVPPPAPAPLSAADQAAFAAGREQLRQLRLALDQERP